MFELDTAAKYKIPVIAVVYNNNCWGMFRPQWDPRAPCTSTCFRKTFATTNGRGIGARGEYVRTPEQLRAALKRSYDAASKETVSSLINVQALKEFTSGNVYRRYRTAHRTGVGAFAH